MSENKDKPSKEGERESIFRVLDELVSHMYAFRNVAMLLIISAFVVVPISLVIAMLLLSGPAFTPGTDVRFVETGMINGTPPIKGAEINASYMPTKVLIQNGKNVTEGGDFFYAIHKGNGIVAIRLPAGPPKFMLTGGAFQPRILDISTIIIIFLIVSVVLSSIYLFVGIKEYSFFARWNKKFSRYTSLREKAEKELGGDKIDSDRRNAS